jgi:hypothetical protein
MSVSHEPNAHPSASARMPTAPRAARAVAVATVAVMVLGMLPAALAIAEVGSALAPTTHPAVVGSGSASPPAAGADGTTSLHTRGVAFNAPGPRPAAWGPSGTPPGWEALGASPFPPSAGSTVPSAAGPSTAAGPDNRFCTGVPSDLPPMSGIPQGTIAAGCYTHDEPAIDFYSALPGSGANVTWNVTLPTDRSTTLNQSDLYSAVWFGMTLSDPAAWMDQCFLEVQFYPDQTFYNPGPLFPADTVSGAWVGAAVGWQVQASTGYENACFYEPLYLSGNVGPAFLNMTQGDRVVVSMSGSSGSTTGETISVRDLTDHQSSTVVAYNSTGGFPLDPAFSTNSYENALPWTQGGDYPVVLGFSTGRAGNPIDPSNNSYGGCSPGLRSTPQDPAAPCAGYDPGSWANDTAAPWKIQVPSFSDAQHTGKSAQVSFTQNVGGIDLESQLASTACLNAAGSGWCSYPWFSYSCNLQAFEFGATDYATFSADFGKYNQYGPHLEESALGLPFYAPTNYSIPTCTSASYNETVATSGSGAGAVYFLSNAYTTATTVPGVGPGTYSINAINSGSGRFDHWMASGGISVALATSAYTSATVTGAGALTAVYSTAARTTKITFAESPTGGSIGLDPSLTYQGASTGSGDPIGTFATHTTHSLTPGVYSVEAYPAAGYVFSSWTATTGLTVASASTPVTWLVVTGGATAATLTAHDIKAGSTAETISLEVVGNGTVTFLGTSVNGTTSVAGTGAFSAVSGSYDINASFGTGTDGVQWVYGPTAVMTNFTANTLVTIGAGPASLEAIFTERASISLQDSPALAGAITYLPPFGPSTTLLNGSLESLAPGTYGLVADPFSGMSFVGWTVTGGATLSAPSQIVTNVTVTSAATVTASYATSAKLESVKLVPSPAGEGSVQLDDMTVYAASGTNSSLGMGLHTVSAIPAPGYLFSHWTGGAKVLLVGPSTQNDQEINVTGTGNSLTAAFTPGSYPFTFVAIQGPGSKITVKVNGIVLRSGYTEYLPPGHYSAPFAGGGIGFNGGWTATSNITFTNRSTTTATFTVAGSGTLYLVLIENGTGSGGPMLVVHPAVASSLSPLPAWAGLRLWMRPS